MADIDINELQNITALADADELLAIVAGLGKNVTWAKVKELLTAQLPEATVSSKGLLSNTVFNRIRHLNNSTGLVLSTGEIVKLGKFTNPHNNGGSILFLIANSQNAASVHVHFCRAYLDGYFNFKAYVQGGSTSYYNKFCLKKNGDYYDLYMRVSAGNSIPTHINLLGLNNFEPDIKADNGASGFDIEINSIEI